jgi:hypothetical protein
MSGGGCSGGKPVVVTTTAQGITLSEAERSGWWRAPAFTFQSYPDGFWDDAAAAQFKQLVEHGRLPVLGGDEERLPSIPWEPRHIPALIKLARDRKLYNRNVAPEVPLRYLVDLATPKTPHQKRLEARAKKKEEEREEGGSSTTTTTTTDKGEDEGGVVDEGTL